MRSLSFFVFCFLFFWYGVSQVVHARNAAESSRELGAVGTAILTARTVSAPYSTRPFAVAQRQRCDTLQHCLL